MPIVKIELFPGRSPEQKERLAVAITEQFAKELGSAPSDVTVLFQEVSPCEWFVGGEPLKKPE